MPTAVVPGNPILPQRSPDEYGISVTQPEGCSRSECDLFIGIDTNTGDNGFLDIYMEGTAEGWLAVGFSETASMVSASLYEKCSRFLPPVFDQKEANNLCLHCYKFI